MKVFHSPRMFFSTLVSAKEIRPRCRGRVRHQDGDTGTDKIQPWAGGMKPVRAHDGDAEASEFYGVQKQIMVLC
jgi:hypothetical protein